MLMLLFFNVPVTLSPAPSVDYNVTEQTHENITRIFNSQSKNTYYFPGVEVLQHNEKNMKFYFALILNHKANKCLEKISFLKLIDTPREVR